MTILGPHRKTAVKIRRDEEEYIYSFTLVGSPILEEEVEALKSILRLVSFSSSEAAY